MFLLNHNLKQYLLKVKKIKSVQQKKLIYFLNFFTTQAKVTQISMISKQIFDGI